MTAQKSIIFEQGSLCTNAVMISYKYFGIKITVETNKIACKLYIAQKDA